MKVINDFKFTLNISNEGYENKKDAIACLSMAGSKAINRNKMAFREETVSTSEFLNYAVSGHSFCNLFDIDPSKKYWVSNAKGISYYMYPTYQKGANKGCMKVCFKADEYFKSSQVIFLDIDYTHFSEVSDYIDALTLKPTCVYMSYSDNIFKKDVAQKNNIAYDPEKGIRSRRFRLVYVFDKQLNKNQLNNISNALNKQIEQDTNEVIQDKCGVKVSQYFNGCFGNEETYSTNTIYSINDFTIYINNNKEEDHQEEEQQENIVITNYTELEKMITSEDKVVEEEVVEEPEVLKEEVVVEDKPLVSYFLINDMSSMSYDDFMAHNRKNYQYIFRVEKPDWIKDEYQFTDEGYFSLYYNVNILKDGSKRRKKLFERMCLRRVINPEATPDTIMFDAYEDVHRFFDNSDDVLSIDCLLKNVESCFKFSVEQIEEKYSDNIAFLRSRRPKIILKKGVSFNIAERNTKLKDIRYSMIDEVYNPNVSVSANLEYICNNVFSISESTLYNYCKNRKISTKISDETIMSYFDSRLSIRKNIELLKGKGIKVSFGKLQKLINSRPTLDISGDTDIDFSKFYQSTSNYLNNWNTNNNIYNI